MAKFYPAKPFKSFNFNIAQIAWLPIAPAADDPEKQREATLLQNPQKWKGRFSRTKRNDDIGFLFRIKTLYEYLPRVWNVIIRHAADENQRSVILMYRF
jgi:hypothetical protein